jgi:hypothetical protein
LAGRRASESAQRPLNRLRRREHGEVPD